MRGYLADLRTVAAWQACAVLLTATGVFSQTLAARGVHAPTAQSFFNYALLSLHGIWLLFRPRRVSSRRPRPWQWLLLAFADVEANFLLVKAYRFSDITSIMLLDAFAVPCAMVLSRGLFGSRYTPQQLTAVAICLGGLALLVVVDSTNQMRQALPHAWFGDVLTLAGAALYALSNVLEERFVKADRTVFFAHLGVYGAVLSGLQTAALEREPLALAWRSLKQADVSGQLELIALALGFSLSLALFYVMVGRLLEAGSSAVTMNLSLLTADFWSVLAGLVLLHSQPSAWYALAFVAVVFGLGIYYSDRQLNIRMFSVSTASVRSSTGDQGLCGEGARLSSSASTSPSRDTPLLS